MAVEFKNEEEQFRPFTFTIDVNTVEGHSQFFLQDEDE